MDVIRFLSLDCTANQGEQQTKNVSVDLFNKATKSIRIIAGDLNSDFYHDEKVVESLERAIKRGVCVEVAFHPVTGKAGKKDTSSSVLGIQGLKVWNLTKPAVRHMMTVDTKHVRIEQQHPSGARITPAVICKNASLLARDIDLNFDTLVKTYGK